MSRPMTVEPIVLEGQLVRLVPLSMRHVDALLPIALDRRVWEFTRLAIASKDQLEEYIADALDLQRQGSVLPFATIERSSGTAVGSTRLVIDPDNRCAEIGWTWLGPAWWRTGINREAKYLMMRQAFDEWNAVRVELKVMARNARSRASLLRLGFTDEGVHRKRYKCADGVIRDAVCFSMLDHEWAGAKARIESALATNSPRAAE